MPAVMAAVGEPPAQGLSAHPHRAGVVAINPEDGAGDLAAPRSDQAGQGDHLTCPDLERDVHEHPLASEAIDLEHGAAWRVRLVLAGQQLAAHHAADEIVRGQPLELLRQDELPIPQDRNPLTEREHLLEAV